MMRDRLIQIRKLLAPDGSVWVHCDDSEQAYLKVMMDEVFGRDNFVSVITWEKRYSRSNDAAISSSHDYLVVFAKSAALWSKIRNRLPRTPQQESHYRNPDNDPRGPWRAIPWDAPNIRPNLSYGITAPTGVVHTPPKGRCWTGTQKRWLEIVEQGRGYFGRDGSGKPSVKRYLSEAPPLVPSTWWPHEETGHNDEAAKESIALFGGGGGFSTAKPERLMQRIIHIASSPGDVVLDCFAGSGTTATVAHKMGRRWVAVESSLDTVETFMKPRLEKVVAGDDPGGITKDVSWEGGGGFRLLEVAPSMFAEMEGRVWLAPWAVDRELAEATAAQLGYDFEPDEPFAGRRGRARLAVVDGLVNLDVIELLLGALTPDERLVVCGTAVDPEATEQLRQLRPGSRTRKIPASILAEYRIARDWRDTPAPEPAPEPASA